MPQKYLLVSIVGFTVFTSQYVAAQNSTQDDFSEMSFDQLMEVEITSVSKKSEKLTNAAAAVYVVTKEELRRSGATSIPEALRLVPGMDVAQVDPNKWAIGIRGFNGRFSNKLLVMIDGRSVYTQSFSGVYWENFDYLINDIERIEVIRGPGATLWGANAVNGVINIITREPDATNKTKTATVAVGNELKHLASFSYDHDFSTDVKARGYVRSKEIGSGVGLDGQDQQNNGEYLQLGGRVDWQLELDQSLVLQADAYNNRVNQEHAIPNFTPPVYFVSPVADQLQTDGANIAARWNKITGLDSEWKLKLNYDYYDRDDIIVTERRNTLDVELQQQMSPIENHELVWGVGYKRSENRLETSAILLTSGRFDTNNWNVFIQDSIEFSELNLSLTAGVKLESINYSDSEIQPNLRASWQPNNSTTLWAAVSRAKRTPSLAETEATISLINYPPYALDPNNPLPTAVRVVGQKDFKPEQVDAFELGWRWQPNANIAFDVASFYNQYDELRGYNLNFSGVELIGLQPFAIAQLVSKNNISGYSQGFELLTRWRYSSEIEYRFVYNYIDTNLEDKWFSGASIDQISADEDRTPNTTASIWAAINLTDTIDLDIKLFYIDERSWTNLPDIHIDSTVNADVRLAWRAQKNLEFSLVGHNLLESQKLEFIAESWPIHTQLERSAFLKAEYSW